MLAPSIDPNLVDRLVGALADRGFAVETDAIPRPLIDRLNNDCRAREASGAMAQVGVGRKDGGSVDASIRHVEAAWLDGTRDGEAAFLAIAEQLRLAINRRLYLGVFEFEAQFLTYPPGGFYERHLDSLMGARNRIVSLVVYLNEAWQQEFGGELDVWSAADDHGAPSITVAPIAGTLVLMLSEEIPHAVRPSHATRRVIAGWFRVNASTGVHVDPAR